MLQRLYKSSLYQFISLPVFKIGLLLVLAASIFFTVQGVQVINALVNNDANSVNLDANLLSADPVDTVRDAILSSPYQTSVMFLPILLALVYSTVYQYGDERMIALLSPSWKRRLTAQVLGLVSLALGLTLSLALVNTILLYFTIDGSLQAYFSLSLVVDVIWRVLLFALLLSLLALVVVKWTRKPILSVVVIVVHLVLSLSGLLKIISPVLDNLLPLIGAKSFAFGRVEGQQTGQVYGFFLLIFEMLLMIGLLYLTERYKWRKEHESHL